jgi:nucleotide-binding universal stress UspA family protein
VEIKRILVPISGSGADEEAVELACTLSNRYKAGIYVVYVIEVERSLPLDARVDSEMEKAEELLTHAEDVAAEEDCDIETDLLQAREAGPGIVNEAMERGADLIVMGVGYKKPLGIFDLGETISYVLREAPCQVLLYRGPAYTENKQ